LDQAVGARVSFVQAGTPAQRADLRVNDVILEFNGIQVENESHLRGLIKLTETGKPADVLIFRDKQPIHASIEVADLKDFPQSEQ
jgi:serine protease Do